ncbi:MAG: SurA N-terminal domain-containing protein [Bauldia sp.]|nr:SurA N-terminal domain-containing protein [Bauldia sp.]
MTSFARRATAAAIALAMLLPATMAFAVSLVATVNGAAITSYDVDQRVALHRISGGAGTQSAALNELIDEVLQLEEAERRGLFVSASQVEAAYGQIAGQVGMSVSQFTGALREAGVHPDTLRKRLRAQIAWAGVMQTLAQAGAINQQDITQQMLGQGLETSTIREYILLPIVFVVPANAGNNVLSQRRSEAEAFRQRFAGCDGVAAQAAGLSGVVVLDMLRRDSTQLSGEQGNAVLNTQAGRTTPPSRTTQGYEVIAVCSITEIQANEQARSQIANELLIQQSEQIGEDYLAELRRSAIVQRY